MTGEDKLRGFAAREFHKDIIRINERIAFFTCWGHSNMTVIEGDTSLILVDSLESDARMARVRAVLAARTDKPVRTLIFTHGHPDHTGGSGALRGEVRDVIAHAPVSAPLPYYDRIGTVLGLARAVGGFGAVLTENNAPVAEMREALSGVTGGLAVAFETTLIALAAALILQLLLTMQLKAEEDLLDAVSDFLNRNS